MCSGTSHASIAGSDIYILSLLSLLLLSLLSLPSIPSIPSTSVLYPSLLYLLSDLLLHPLITPPPKLFDLIQVSSEVHRYISNESRSSLAGILLPPPSSLLPPPSSLLPPPSSLLPPPSSLLPPPSSRCSFLHKTGRAKSDKRLSDPGPIRHGDPKDSCSFHLPP